MRIIVFDTETTGLPKTKFINPDTLNKWPHIVQLSYVIYDTDLNEIVEVNDYIIKMNENVIIPEDSINIHKITNEISQEKGLKIDIILNKFIKDLNSTDMLVGHNILFDINMVKVELLRLIYEKDLQKSEKSMKSYKDNLYLLTNYKNIYCTLKESIELCNIKTLDKYGKEYLKYPKLIELHNKLFNTNPNNLHNALNDILVTLRCFMKLKYNMDLNDVCCKFQNMSQEIQLL
jgi:DNA polymerase III epsilon subunit-like protein